MALMDYPNATMIDILRILSDKDYRRNVVEHIKDPVIKDFWTKEFEGYNDKLRSEAIAPIQNKVGQFVSSPIIRNIIGQPKSTINIDDIINNNKILLVNLSKGKIGEDNSALLGAMLITKIQLAAMNRAYIPEEERKDFFMYVDEFQNFATESFATIFSEARKYKLSIIVANQYIAQMPEEVRDAVFGNVGTIISFRVGAQDAPYLAKEMAPVFDETDLINLDKFHIYVKMSIDGVTSPAFSAITLPPMSYDDSYAEHILESSRMRFTKPRAEVEQIIEEAMAFKVGISAEQPKPEKKKGKGPSAIIRVKGKRWFEYVDKEGHRWYQQEPDQTQANAESTQVAIAENLTPHTPTIALQNSVVNIQPTEINQTNEVPTQMENTFHQEAPKINDDNPIAPAIPQTTSIKEPNVSVISNINEKPQANIIQPIEINQTNEVPTIQENVFHNDNSANQFQQEPPKQTQPQNINQNSQSPRTLPNIFERPEPDKIETQFPQQANNQPTIIQPNQPIQIDPDK
jgi:hypothetical protein